MQIKINNSDFDRDLIKEISKIENKKSFLSCFQCGICSSSCPIGETFPFNPHEIIKLAGLGINNQILDKSVLNFCLTCGKCQEDCPQDVDFIEFIKSARKLLVDKIIKYEETHHGILSLISEIQAKSSSGLKLPKEILLDNLKISKKGSVGYFVGCLPILDVVFENLHLNLIDIAKNGIKILNEVFDEPPILLDNMKCCGHDALWKGYFDNFQKLAQYNVNEIKKLGIKTIITTCAECYRTLKIDYPKYFDVDFEVIHLTELISEKIKNNQLDFIDTSSQTVTYHDPCRLGRHMKVYSAPRDILNSMGNHGVEFNEMQRIKESSVCCGVSCFINCNESSKALQLDRLTEAESVANLMVTTCPKCQIHYNCMLQEKKESATEEIRLVVSDLTNLIAHLMKFVEDEKEVILTQK